MGQKEDWCNGSAGKALAARPEALSSPNWKERVRSCKLSLSTRGVAVHTWTLAHRKGKDAQCFLWSVLAMMQVLKELICLSVLRNMLLKYFHFYINGSHVSVCKLEIILSVIM